MWGTDCVLNWILQGCPPQIYLWRMQGLKYADKTSLWSAPIGAKATPAQTEFEQATHNWDRLQVIALGWSAEIFISSIQEIWFLPDINRKGVVLQTTQEESCF